MSVRLSPSSWNIDIDHYVNPWLPPAPWSRIPRPIARFLGHRDTQPQRIGNVSKIFWAFIGIFCSILLIEVVGRQIPSFRDHGAPVIVGSFGAAAVLEFYAIDSPLAQPRNAVLGQLISSIVGIAIRKLFSLAPPSQDLTWVAGALSCACAVSAMGSTGTVHPPAGATALLAVVDEKVASLGWFLLPVILLGSVLMQCVALLLNNVQRRFPAYWWTPEEVGQRWRRRAISEGGKGGSDIDIENGAKWEHIASRQPGGHDFQEKRTILISKELIHVPEDIHLTLKERVLLEELSCRL